MDHYKFCYYIKDGYLTYYQRDREKKKLNQTNEYYENSKEE